MSVVFNGVAENHIGRINQWGAAYMALGRKKVDNWDSYTVTFSKAKYIIHKKEPKIGDVEFKTSGTLSNDDFDIYPNNDGTVINVFLTNNA